MRGGHALRPSKACDLDKVIITKCGPFDYAKAETRGIIFWSYKNTTQGVFILVGNNQLQNFENKNEVYNKTYKTSTPEGWTLFYVPTENFY